ncbi:MAG: hypothetical protein ACREAC_12355, partial [Blastocatellia bacterium]
MGKNCRKLIRNLRKTTGHVSVLELESAPSVLGRVAVAKRTALALDCWREKVWRAGGPRRPHAFD